MDSTRSRRALLVATALAAAGCADQRDHSGQPGALSALVPLHLEEHLEQATVEGSEVPADLPEPLGWTFDEPSPDWTPTKPIPEGWAAVEVAHVDGVLRLSLSEPQRNPWGQLDGTVHVELPDSTRFEDWGFVEIRARTSDRMRVLGVSYNLDDEHPFLEDGLPFRFDGDRTPLVTDGTVQRYLLSLDAGRPPKPSGRWTHLAVWCTCEAGVEQATLDLVSVRLIPRELAYAGARVGVRMEGRRTGSGSARVHPDRRALFSHTPGTLSWRVKIPEGGRLDVGLGVVRENAPVTFAVSAQTAGGARELLLEATHGDPGRWEQRSVDLARFAGSTVTLALQAQSPHSGAVALWAAPTLSGSRATELPNVILYVIDGACADYMSAYGYPRRTTPRLERIAAMGATFERAYSNSSWTRPSTASFLTGLHHSVLGGLRDGRNPVPMEVPTMAERMHGAGYLTARFTTNPNAGRMSHLDRGVDLFREAGYRPHSISTVDLHENFWAWRTDYPAEPWWVHFQPTDVHNDHTPVAPFAGLFIDSARRRTVEGWLAQVEAIPETDEVRIGEAAEAIGADRIEFWTAQRDLHDETLAHQDHQLGRLVERLQATGEWERTLLVVASDHGVAAGSWDYSLLMRDPEPEHVYHDDLATPMLRSGVSRIPLIFVWPGRIAPGQRFSEPVSMIDVLPTILELAGLPPSETAQGRSLAPLLLGEAGLPSSPIVLDEFSVDAETGELRGRIEVVDGRWGASLGVAPPPDLHPRFRRAAPLLLFDLWEDPECLRSLHAERADLVERYTRFLEARLEEHRELGSRFERPEASPLASDQLEALRDLGYVGEGR